MHIKELLKGMEIRDQHRHILGGSSISGLMGIGDYACPLAIQKAMNGDEYTNVWYGNSATERGKHGEPLAANYYAEKTGRKLRQVPRKFVEIPEFMTWRCLCFKTHDPGTKMCPVCQCDLPRPIFAPWSDREIVNDARGPELGAALLSVKCPSTRVFKKITYDGPSYDYIAQIQSEMWAWRRKWSAYIFFSLELWADRSYDIDYDPALGDATADAILKFMVRLENGPLYDRLPASSKACQNCQFFTACHGSDLIAEATDKDAEGLTFKRVEDPAIASRLVQIAEVRSVRKEAEEEEKRLVEELRKDIGEMNAFECPDTTDPTMRLRIYYRQQAGRETFSWSDFKKKNKDKDMLEKLKPFVSTSAGSRPLRIYKIPNAG